MDFHDSRRSVQHKASASPSSKARLLYPDQELAANQDYVLAGLGFWMVASPWLFQFSDSFAPRWTALVVGALVVLMAFENKLWPSRYGQWAALALGLLLFCSPFFLGGYHPPQAAANAVTIGAALVGWSGWSLDRQHDERVAAGLSARL
jgi:peptidoglycan/LPS O-acetylase OafA/YrhL